MTAEVKNIGNTVLKLARGLGVEKSALRRSRSIMEYADKNEWIAARNEWDGVFSDLQSGMIEIKSKELAQLVSVGGWLRGQPKRSVLLCSRNETFPYGARRDSFILVVRIFHDAAAAPERALLDTEPSSERQHPVADVFHFCGRALPLR